MTKHSFASFMIAGSIALAVPLAALAHSMMDGPCGQFHGHGEHGLFGGDEFPPFLRGLDLTESQRDKVFEILHAQAPALREKGKDARKAREELRALALSGQYDEAKARTLAESAAKAKAETAQMHARTANQIYRLLTAEQQKQLKENLDRLESRGFGGRYERRHRT
jgi:periplasmic protein CpxP/Spy